MTFMDGENKPAEAPEKKENVKSTKKKAEKVVESDSSEDEAPKKKKQVRKKIPVASEKDYKAKYYKLKYNK